MTAVRAYPIKYLVGNRPDGRAFAETPEQEIGLSDAQIREQWGHRAAWVWSDLRYGGDAARLAQAIKACGFDAVYLKASDGGRRWEGQYNRQIIDTFLSHGLKVAGWHYVYGKHAESQGPEAEAAAIIWAANVYPGLPQIADVEYEWLPDADANDRAFFTALDLGEPNTGLAYAPDLRIASGNRWYDDRCILPDGGGMNWALWNHWCRGGCMPQLYVDLFRWDVADAVGLMDAWTAWCMSEYALRALQAAEPTLLQTVVPRMLPLVQGITAPGTPSPTMLDAIRTFERQPCPSISVWRWDPAVPRLPETGVQRPALDESWLQGGYGSRGGHFQVIREGHRPHYESDQQWRDVYFTDCGPIAVAHVANMARWAQNDPDTLGACSSIDACVANGSYRYGDLTLSIPGLGDAIHSLCGVTMIYRTTGSWDPNPALGWEEALDLARTRPIVVNKPGHIAAAVADRSGRALLWLVQGSIGPSYSGDDGALTPANWHEWNWQTLHPAEPLWSCGEQATDELPDRPELHVTPDDGRAGWAAAAHAKQRAHDLALQRDGQRGAFVGSEKHGGVMPALEVRTRPPALTKP